VKISDSDKAKLMNSGQVTRHSPGSSAGASATATSVGAANGLLPGGSDGA